VQWACAFRESSGNDAPAQAQTGAVYVARCEHCAVSLVLNPGS